MGILLTLLRLCLAANDIAYYLAYTFSQQSSFSQIREAEFAFTSAVFNNSAYDLWPHLASLVPEGSTCLLPDDYAWSLPVPQLVLRMFAMVPNVDSQNNWFLNLALYHCLVEARIDAEFGVRHACNWECQIFCQWVL